MTWDFSVWLVVVCVLFLANTRLLERLVLHATAKVKECSKTKEELE